MAFLELAHLDKSFGANHVVKDFNLSIEKGEFVSLLGPSGCGKTTVLRMVGGFEDPTAGSISIDGQDVTRLKSNQRNIGMVFQAYALFPNLTVAQNVAFGLKVAGIDRKETADRVTEMLTLIGLADLGARYPFQLSGGQQQRVALARALAVRPKVLLLDEPLSALDAKIRASLRREIRGIQQRLGITTIFVTHDQEEALSMSDRVVVMTQGRADQIGTPFEIYNNPATRFVAGFVGTLNTFDATLTDPATGTVSLGDTQVVLNRPVKAAAGAPVALAMRPESATLGAGQPGDVTLTGRITEVQFLGAIIRITADLGKQSLTLDTFNRSETPPPAVGSDVTISLPHSGMVVLAD
ncbi:ABC transporter ATP-binding protein [Loktanella sp. M215]|uniref:ABC transporter ATP-binding protein n=1 Tax=Loktanella sp. M215 TaxID=2675431 RepID=UPI001F1FB761|nr:ABC transporter ATP-binding protein [Loktanella sp. M215]MCF7698994.1 ATP-binding cassette domain-containing protein [Loktanella sp. M215]